MTYIVEGIGDQSEEMVSLVNDFGGEFVEILSKLAQEAVEHEFGRGFASGIFLIREGSIAIPSFCWYWQT